MTARVRLRALVILGAAFPACSSPNVGDAGCQAFVQQQLPGTALTLLRDAQLLAGNDGSFVLAGADGPVVRWMTIAPDGTLGTEQVVPIPEGATFSALALAGTAADRLDTLLVGVVTASADGLSGELHFILSPLDGSPSSAMGPAVLTFPDQPEGPARLVMAAAKPRPSDSPGGALNAAVAWIDPAPAVNLAFVDSGGVVAGGPVFVDGVQSTCLAVTGDTIDPAASFLVTFLRAGDTTATTSWEEGEVWADGSVRTSLGTVAEGNRTMLCAIGTPTSGNDYSFAWQDSSGSWLSVLSGRTIDDLGNVSNEGSLVSHPFVPATDFGGPDVQPPIVGFAAVGRGGTRVFVGDYMVAFARPHDVEIWRLDWQGRRRPGTLILPSALGNLGGVSSVNTGRGMALTYADYDSSTTTGNRWLVNATCY